MESWRREQGPGKRPWCCKWKSLKSPWWCDSAGNYWKVDVTCLDTLKMSMSCTCPCMHFMCAFSTRVRKNIMGKKRIINSVTPLEEDRQSKNQHIKTSVCSELGSTQKVGDKIGPPCWFKSPQDIWIQSKLIP